MSKKKTKTKEDKKKKQDRKIITNVLTSVGRAVLQLVVKPFQIIDVAPSVVTFKKGLI